MKYLTNKKTILSIIFGVFVVSFLGNYIIIQTEYYQEKQRQDKILEERLINSLDQQREALQKANEKINDLEKESSLSKILRKQKIPENKTENVLSSEINKYLTGIVSIECDDMRGSGFLWKTHSEYLIMTNQHVIESYKKDHCTIYVDDIENKNTLGIYFIKISENKNPGNSKDFASFPIHDFLYSPESETAPQFKRLSELNYNLSLLEKCSNKISLGSPLVVIGYPAFTEKVVSAFGYTQTQKYRTITNGIISSYDSSSTGIFGDSPNSNYFTSAKIDSGNSGGIALSKENGDLCILGIPTWLNLGNYETQGIIQNINNLIN